MHDGTSLQPRAGDAAARNGVEEDDTTHGQRMGGAAATYNNITYNGMADGGAASGGEAMSGKESRRKGRRGTAAPADDSDADSDGEPALAAASDSEDSDAELELKTTKAAAHRVQGREAGVPHTGPKP